MNDEDGNEEKFSPKDWLITIGVIVLILGGALAFGMYIHRNDDKTSAEPDPNGYSNCSEAHAAGVYDIPSSSPAYNPKQDADHDGIACERFLGN